MWFEAFASSGTHTTRRRGVPPPQTNRTIIRATAPEAFASSGVTAARLMPEAIISLALPEAFASSGVSAAHHDKPATPDRVPFEPEAFASSGTLPTHDPRTKWTR